MKASRALLIALASLALAAAAPTPRLSAGGDELVVKDAIGVCAVARSLRHGQTAPLGVVALAAEIYAFVPYALVEPFTPEAAERLHPTACRPPRRARAPPLRG